MTRLPMVTSNRLVRTLERLGFRKKHQKGSHLFMEHADGRATVIPMHKGEDIGRGLLRKILRDIRMEPTEFMQFV